MGADSWPVEIDPVYSCWLWTGRTDRRDGRALTWRGSAPAVAYRVVLDHACKRPSCCAPHHLEPCTQRENLLRRKWSYLVRRTHCKAGHSMRHAQVSPEGGRCCRECTRLALGGMTPGA
jgi:hypothetical protein